MKKSAQRALKIHKLLDETIHDAAFTPITDLECYKLIEKQDNFRITKFSSIGFTDPFPQPMIIRRRFLQKDTDNINNETLTRYRKEAKELNKELMRKHFLFEAKPKKVPRIKQASVTAREDGGFLNIETAHNQFKPHATGQKEGGAAKHSRNPSKQKSKPKSMP